MKDEREIKMIFYIIGLILEVIILGGQCKFVMREAVGRKEQ